MGKKISIVFEDNGLHHGRGFNVYLQGYRPDLHLIPEDQYSPIEWHAMRMFSMITQKLQTDGAIEDFHELDPDAQKH